MKRQTYKLGLALAVLLLVGAATSASAMAASEWLLNGAAIATAMAVNSKGSLKFADSKGGLFGEKLELECEATDKGTVGPGTSDHISQFTTAKCTTLTGICGAPEFVDALHLGWDTTLALVGTEWRDKIENGGTGIPGWEIVCDGFVEDECTGETSTELDNTPGGVNGLFNAKSAKFNCTRGGTGAGTEVGNDLTESPAGETLSVS